MIYLIIFVIIIWMWMLYEFRRAPHMDDSGNIKRKKK
jgi:uncharacterized membrane protein (DUF106 family)